MNTAAQPPDNHQLTAADNRQHDLKGRMPKRSEWLVAEGERSVTLGIMPPHHYAKNANITFLGICFRVLQTLFFLVAGIPGVALTLNPRLRALGLRPRHSTFQVGYLCRGVIKNTDYHKHDTDKHNNVKIRA